MKATLKAQCKNCRELFVVKHRNQKYCSPGCRISHNNLRSNRMALRNRKLADLMLQQEQLVRQYYILYSNNGKAFVPKEELLNAGLVIHGPFIKLSVMNESGKNEHWRVYGHYAIAGIHSIYYIIQQVPENEIIRLRRIYGDLF